MGSTAPPTPGPAPPIASRAPIVGAGPGQVFVVSNQPMGRAQAPGVPMPTQGMAPQGMLNLGGVRAQNSQQQPQQLQQQQQQQNNNNNGDDSNNNGHNDNNSSNDNNNNNG